MVKPSTTDFFIALAVWTICALAVFRHAERHGSRHATAWGISVFLVFLLALPLYIVYSLWSRRRARAGANRAHES